MEPAEVILVPQRCIPVPGQPAPVGQVIARGSDQGLAMVPQHIMPVAWRAVPGRYVVVAEWHAPISLQWPTAVRILVAVVCRMAVVVLAQAEVTIARHRSGRIPTSPTCRCA